jgi:cytochrome c oxidase cbb3-type subunit 2
MSRPRIEHGPPESRGIGIGAFAGGTALCLVLAFVVGVLLPVNDAANGARAAGKARQYTSIALAGRALYIREGCFQCHTQVVRNTFSDFGLGPRPSEAGDYANEAPNLIGTIRLGPDLTCVGDRQKDATWQIRHLKNPEGVRPRSTMPHYAYLSNKELQALAEYLLSLTCEG